MSLLFTYVAIGALIGLVTYTSRHLYGEGPSKGAREASPDGVRHRLYWLLVCCYLWPVLVAGRLYASWKNRA